VTIVEFFDPACEACRSFHPNVKKILAQNPDDVRLVLRYAAFQDGSDEAVRNLGAARLQNRFEPVLEALYEAQPVWANHGKPDLEAAWQAAPAGGLDVAQARADADRPADRCDPETRRRGRRRGRRPADADVLRERQAAIVVRPSTAKRRRGT
jgi:alkylhydroperoxidase family enzyme